MPRIRTAASCPRPAGCGPISPPRCTGVRVDSGVVEGGEISGYYDPMIAKLVTLAPTRDRAIERQLEALDRYLIRGIGHNIDFLAAVMAHPRFRAGRQSRPVFIAEEFPTASPARRRPTPGRRR